MNKEGTGFIVFATGLSCATLQLALSNLGVVGLMFTSLLAFALGLTASLIDQKP